MTLNGEFVIFFGKKFNVFVKVYAADRPSDNFVKSVIAVDTVDNDSVLKSKIAVIDNAKFGKLVCTTGFP